MALTPEMEKIVTEAELFFGMFEKSSSRGRKLSRILAAEVRRLDAALTEAEAALRKERETVRCPCVVIFATLTQAKAAKDLSEAVERGEWVRRATP